MSRSYHVTRKQVINARAGAYTEDSELIEQYIRLGRQYYAKRLAKNRVKQSRKQRTVPQDDPIDRLPITITDSSPFLHYPATEADVRALLKRMPKGLIDGLDHISFCLSKQDQRRTLESRDEEAEKDPYFNRVSYKVFENVYGPRILGTYYTWSCHIRLNGYVYDPQMQYRPLIDLYLKIHMLATFVHELAHHYDHARRVFGDRWRMDNVPKAENYAETMAHQWIGDYVLPYVEQAYPAEMRYLKSWMKEKLGVVLGLPLLAGDCRATEKDGAINVTAYFFNTSRAFEDFVRHIQLDHDIQSSRVEFAQDVHYADHYAIAQKVLNQVFKQNPHHIDALAVYSDICGHLGRYDEALKLARKIVQRQRSYIDAYRIICMAYVFKEQWRDVLKWSLRALDYAQNRWEQFFFMRHKINALIQLDMLDEAQVALDELRQLFKGNRLVSIIKKLESEIKKKTGKAKV